MKVDALEEVVMHIETQLQALNVKLSLSCNAEYWWICVTPLKINKTDYNLEKIRNYISGVWNSSSITLDLGKLHTQIKTMEHSRLDFTAAGATNDFSSYIFEPYFRKKNILSTIFSYTAVVTLILLLIIMLPCFVRILLQSTQKLTTELHLADLKNKKGRDARSHHGRSHP